MERRRTEDRKVEEKIDWKEEPRVNFLKGRHGSANKGDFESGQNKSRTCSYIFIDRECNPFCQYHGHKSQTLFQRGQYFVATNQQQLNRLPTTVSTLNAKTGVNLFLEVLFVSSGLSPPRTVLCLQTQIGLPVWYT